MRRRVLGAALAELSLKPAARMKPVALDCPAGHAEEISDLLRAHPEEETKLDHAGLPCIQDAKAVECVGDEGKLDGANRFFRVRLECSAAKRREGGLPFQPPPAAGPVDQQPFHQHPSRAIDVLGAGEWKLLTEEPLVRLLYELMGIEAGAPLLADEETMGQAHEWSVCQLPIGIFRMRDRSVSARIIGGIPIDRSLRFRIQHSAGFPRQRHFDWWRRGEPTTGSILVTIRVQFDADEALSGPTAVESLPHG